MPALATLPLCHQLLLPTGTVGVTVTTLVTGGAAGAAAEAAAGAQTAAAGAQPHAAQQGAAAGAQHQTGVQTGQSKSFVWLLHQVQFARLCCMNPIVC